jgi:hypothetical protein
VLKPDFNPFHCKNPTNENELTCMSPLEYFIKNPKTVAVFAQTEKKLKLHEIRFNSWYATSFCQQIG